MSFTARVILASALVLPSANVALAADQVSVLHSLVKGEQFVYSRVITYRNPTGIQHEHSQITLEVSDVSPSGTTIVQRISVNGAKEKIRSISAAADGGWTYPDTNTVAQDFVTWDRNQLGPAPAEPHPGFSQQVVVPISAMFVAGTASSKIVEVDGDLIEVSVSGDVGRKDENRLDEDTHKYVPVSSSGSWSEQETLKNGIVQRFHRTDLRHYNVNNDSLQADDDVDVLITLVSYHGI